MNMQLGCRHGILSGQVLMLPTHLRRQEISNLLRRHEVQNQAQLLGLLVAGGIQVTQPQLSRDLRALRAVKRDGAYRLSERVTPLAKLASLLRDAQPAGANLLVIRCEPGAASAVARALEGEQVALEENAVVGTIAGDDTVFVALRERRYGTRILNLIHSLIE